MNNPRVPPWSPQYKSDSNPVPPGIDVGAIIANAEADAGAVVGTVTTDVQQATGGNVPLPTIPVVSGALATVIAQAKTAAVADAEKTFEAKVIAFLEDKVPQAPAAPTLEPQDVTNAAARGRALRSLLYGVLLTVFWALVSAITTAVNTGGTDFFSKTGLIQVATLAAGTVGHALLSYLGRITVAPNPPE
jgi:hypothetical protein